MTTRFKTKTKEGKTETKTKTTADKTDFQNRDIRLPKRRKTQLWIWFIITSFKTA